MAAAQRAARRCGGSGGGCELSTVMKLSWRSWILLVIGICSVGLDGNGNRGTGGRGGGGGGGGGSGWFSLSLGPQFYGAYAQNPASSTDEAFIPKRTVIDFLSNTALDPKIIAPDDQFEHVLHGNIKSIHVAEAGSSSAGYFSIWFTPFVGNRRNNMSDDTLKRGEIWRFDLSTRELSLVAGTRFRQGYVEGKGAKAVFNLPSSLAVSADGNTLYVLDNYNDMVRTVDLSSNSSNQTGVFFQLQGNASAPSVSTTNFHQQDASNATLKRSGQVLNMYSRMTFDPIEGMFYLTTNQSIVLINANTKKINRTYDLSLIGQVDVALSRDASWLFVTDHVGDGLAGKLHVLNLTAGRGIGTGGEGGGGVVGGEIRSMGRHEFGLLFRPWGLALTSEGSHLFIGDLAKKSVRLVRLSADRRSVVNMTDVVANADRPECIAVARNESTLLVGNLVNPDDWISENQLFVGEINTVALLAFGENSTLSLSPTPAPSLSLPSVSTPPEVPDRSAKTDSSTDDLSSSNSTLSIGSPPKPSSSSSLLSFLHVNLALASLASYLSLTYLITSF